MQNPKLLFDHDLLWPERGQVDKGARHGFYLYPSDTIHVDFRVADRRPVTVSFGKGYHGQSTVRLKKGILFEVKATNHYSHTLHIEEEGPYWVQIVGPEDLQQYEIIGRLRVERRHPDPRQLVRSNVAVPRDVCSYSYQLTKGRWRKTIERQEAVSGFDLLDAPLSKDRDRPFETILNSQDYSFSVTEHQYQSTQDPHHFYQLKTFLALRPGDLLRIRVGTYDPSTLDHPNPPLLHFGILNTGYFQLLPATMNERFIYIDKFAVHHLSVDFCSYSELKGPPPAPLPFQVALWNQRGQRKRTLFPKPVTMEVILDTNTGFSKTVKEPKEEASAFL